MSKVLLKNTEKEVSGFYYDCHRKNPMMRVTLHANTKEPDNPFEPWPTWCSSGIPDIDEPDSPVTVPYVINGATENTDVRYGALPICSSIINEDFNISIANTWADFAGGSQITDLFNSYKAFEPYAHKISPMLKDMASGILESAEKHKSSWMETASNFVDHIGDSLGKKGNQLSRNLVVQGTRFKYYSGTGIAFSNLGMRFTLFADQIEVINETRNGLNYTGKYKFMTPDQQLNYLMPYATGLYSKFIEEGSIKGTTFHYNKLKGDGSGDSEKVEFSLSDVVKHIPFIPDEQKSKITGNEFEKELNTYLGWQFAPGGFRSSIDYVDSVQTGTLMLKIGPYYRLKNLVIQDIQLNYSKHMAKYYEGGVIKTCPLYCDVSITFSPANKYSDQMLREFVMSRSRTTGDIPKSIKNLEKDINSNIGIN